MHCRHTAWTFTALLLGIGSQAAAAQGIRPVSGGPTFGVLAGVNFSKLGGDDISGVDSRTGFTVGGFASFHITPVLAIQPELLYSQKGFSSNSSPDGEGTFELNYIDVPLLMRFDIPTESGQITPFFMAGPAFGLQISCGVSGSSGGVSVSAGCDAIDDALEEFGADFETKTFDLSGVLAAGLDFRIGAQKLMLAARYEHGFTNVMELGSAKNRTWSILAGLGF